MAKVAHNARWYSFHGLRFSIFYSPQVHALSEESIADTLSQRVKVTASQVILLFYVLYYNESIPPQTTTEFPAYSAALLESVPVKHILDHAELSPGFNDIYPDLLCCVANQFPELFDVNAALIAAGSRERADMESRLTLKKPRRAINMNVLKEHLHQPAEAARELRYVVTLPPSDLMDRMDAVVSTVLPSLLDERSSPTVQEAFIAVWDSMNSLAPRELWVSTVNCLCNEDTVFTLNSLMADPIILFKADTRIFRSPILFPIFLSLLGSLRTASKHKAWQRFSAVFAQKEQLFNARNLTTMMYAQDSTMLQFLLEICLPKDDEPTDPLESIRRQICSFIHGLFIDDQILLKLLHFQTYDKRLLPMMMKLVPSIYITSNFLGELLRQPQPEQQVFGILLAGYLFEKYPLENYAQLAEKSVLPRLSRLAFPKTRDGSVPAIQPTPYLLEALPATRLLAEAFPHLAPEILTILNEISSALPSTKDVDFWADPKSMISEQIRTRLDHLKPLVQFQADNMDRVNKSTM
ncbi:hypothetical protein INT44_002672 [Umbelopsis vinacea]|uniref:Uncharacterized protein n=1 Tax=Umbelopsis vinacea TaxID=44442 RepID=A0A8H7Q6Y2_9FUNG|nr:hypothetical protein INT44_002672 [Umbelopsis vinacea]